jgi:hypothetical protein
VSFYFSTQGVFSQARIIERVKGELQKTALGVNADWICERFNYQVLRTFMVFSNQHLDEGIIGLGERDFEGKKDESNRVCAV